MESNSVLSNVIRLIVAVILLVCCQSIYAAHYASVVMEYPSRTILYSENLTSTDQPASLTKVMTLYLVFQALDKGALKLSQPLRVSQHAANRQPSKLGLRAGDTISVENAICGVVTKSANDAATVLAESLAPNEDDFAKRMTEQAHKLGMNQTTFMNASGVPNNKQLTTARDMALLGAAIMQDFPHYYHYFSLKEFTFHNIIFKNHNHLLVKYPGCDGIKTGFTAASGFNLLSSAERNGHRLIAVVLGGNSIKSRDLRVMQLLNTGFSKLATANNESNQIKVSQELTTQLETPSLDSPNTTIEEEF